MQEALKKSLKKFNKDRTDKGYQVGDKVFFKSNKRLGNKLSEQTIEADQSWVAHKRFIKTIFVNHPIFSKAVTRKVKGC